MDKKRIYFIIILIGTLYFALRMISGEMDNNINIISEYQNSDYNESHFISFSNARQKQKLLFIPEAGVAEQDSFVKNNNIENPRIFYHGHFLKHGTLEIDKNIFKTTINYMIPNRNDSGYAIIDFEGEEYYNIAVLENISEYKYLRALNNFVKVYSDLLDFAKTQRPYVKWSFFDIPPVKIPIANTSYEKYMVNLYPLFRKVDFFAPSLYLIKSPSEESGRYRTTDFIISNIAYNIKLGYTFKKEVYPFIWHRYPPVSKIYNDTIPVNIFYNYINSILNTSYNNRKVNGIIWWQSESYSFQHRLQVKSIINEYKNIKNPQKYQVNTLQKYYSILNDFFK